MWTHLPVLKRDIPEAREKGFIVTNITTVRQGDIELAAAAKRWIGIYYALDQSACGGGVYRVLNSIT